MVPDFDPHLLVTENVYDIFISRLIRCYDKKHLDEHWWYPDSELITESPRCLYQRFTCDQLYAPGGDL